MGRVERYPHGTFCWVELETPDLDSAARFYGDLLGWTVDLDADRGTARLDGEPVAGLRRRDVARATWWSWIAVDQPDAIARSAAALGGSGSAEEITDPTGAHVGLRPAGAAAGASVVNEIGAWCWNELVTPDLPGALDFYTGLLGWGADPAPGAPIERRTITRGELLIAGAHAPQPGEGSEARWQVSFRVGDARAAAARATELGGSVLLEPIAIPIGAMTVVADPAGAEVTLTEFEGPFRGVDGSAERGP